MSKCVTIGAIADIRAGFPFRSRPEVDVNGSTCLIQMKNVNESRTAVDLSGAMRFTPVRNLTAHHLKDGDVLFMGRGHSMFACPVGAPPTASIAVGLFFVLSVRSKEQVLPEYLAWVLNLKSTLDKLLLASGSGVSMPVVRRKVLEELEVSLPDICTQRKIVELDRLMIREKNLMKKLAEKRDTLVHAACEKILKDVCQRR